MSAPQSHPAHTNRLAKETSPYLLQHQHNPVDWFPWGTEAFEKARNEKKPVFLSVGYSTCHWCHVMERESFENEAVAALLNKEFVCVKVDREERPDVDDIYMKYVHMTQQSGGWPMSVVLTPEGAPFFAGTYFPREQFTEMMGKIALAYRQDHERVDEIARKSAEALKHEAEAVYRQPERPLGRETAARLVDLLAEHFDYANGGLPGRRKFPPHGTLEFLLYVVEREPGNAPARKMLVLTLDKMQLGGIHDHLGGGFHRYATDAVWLLPHFEKMLYDNAQLGRAYARAALLLKEEAYARTARDIFDWALREMRSPEGAFYSAYDADSEGEEGKFYVWHAAELGSILGADAVLFQEIYNCKVEGNFREEATGHETGLNIPHLNAPLAEHARRLKLEPEQLFEKVEGWKRKLLAVRVKRVWPHLDDKILTSWNALMIGSLAQGSLALKEPRYLEAALQAAEFLLAHLRTPEGRWLATHNKGASKLPAYLDDHAYLARACMDLYAATGAARWKEEAAAVVQALDAHFWDERAGGYFFVADDHEKLLVRMKNPADNATPSGNGIAAQSLVALWRATGEVAYARRAARLFKAFHTLLDLAPVEVESILLALDTFLREGGTLDEPAPAAEGKPAPDRKKVQRGPAIAELILGCDKLAAGGKTPLAVRLTLDEGWHVQPAKQAQPNRAATRLRLASKNLGRLSGEVYPATQQLPGGLEGYAGEVLLGAWLELPAETTLGDTVLEVEVEFQACGARTCELPQKVLLAIPTAVVEGKEGILESDAAVFRALGMKQ